MGKREIEVNKKENYRGFDILEYVDEDMITFGIFQDVTLLIPIENYDLEDLLIDEINDTVLELYSFDSEAEHFCVIARKIEQIKWIIDYIIITLKIEDKIKKNDVN